MKIAYIVPSLRNQGPIIVVRNLVDYLVKQGHIVCVYYFDDINSAMEFKCPTMHISMKKPIDFDKYDIVHTHCLRPDIYAVKWEKRICRAKIISTLHQDTYRSFCYLYNPILSYLFMRYWCWKQSKFDGVISISNQLRDIYREYIKAPITTIYNGCAIKMDEEVDNRLVNIIEKLKLKYKILGSYAYVTRGKGLEQIIHTLPSLHDYAFVIIGEGPDIENLKQETLTLGISNRVVFFPYQKNPCNYLPYIDVYVMPSYSEGFGLSMVEAALGKKAIVCSDILSFHEIFSNEEVCFFELDNMYSLQKAIKAAFENRELYGEKAYNKAMSKFTVQKMVENHLKYYESVL